MSRKTSLPVGGTPLMRQYQEVKQQYPDTLVLFRMGDFYETFAEDAQITSRVLGIVLTKRSNGAAADIPLAGFPYHALDNYLHKLVAAGHRVAICEQVEDPKLAKGIVKREVIEVVTPGTITSERALDQKANRYLAALTIRKEQAGFALLDQSTGEFYVGDCPENRLAEALRKFGPQEVLIGQDTTYSTDRWYRDLKPFITRIDDWLFNYESSYRTLIEHFKVTSLKGFGCEELLLGVAAGGALLRHLRDGLNASLAHISSLRPVHDEDIMGLDGFTVRNLEVFKSLATQGTHGTLVDILDQTITAGGGRLLRQWLNRPLTDLERLNRRLDTIAGLLAHKRVLEDIRGSLRQIADIERIIGRVSQGKAGPRDMSALGTALELVPTITRSLTGTGQTALAELATRFQDSSEIYTRIGNTLVADPPAQLKAGHYINPGVDPELDERRDLARGGKDWIAGMQAGERERTGISTLKVGYNRIFGYYIEITKAHQDKVPEEYIRKQTLVNSERYITPDLKEYEEKILTAEEQVDVIETRIFRELCQYILSAAELIQANARAYNRLDLLTALATTAGENHYVRPELTEEPLLTISDGRHPVVERLLPATERFIPNDTRLDARSSQILLITGPNMAGKSTYLRQVGLLVLMAQIGSFIPAAKATVGLVDKLFTRVGASDNLAGGESTFLVEMNEAANILNNATARSLIILDEIGRGTATFDGLSLAWAITEYLHNTATVAARTLFATHYHELTDLEHTLERLENHHAAVEEFGERIIFLRKILPGPGDKSYGIHVARMAGLPATVIRRAKSILNHHLELSIDSGTAGPPAASQQISMFTEQETRLRQALTDLDINNLTPLEALQALDDLKKQHGL
ncbi:MAG: DNA mismatch repair protein MutS [Candidatus Neomarinimicrobiota bacterium]